MDKEHMTIREATHEWVDSFNAIQRGMINKLMEADPDNWREVTIPTCGDRVYVYDLPDEVDMLRHIGKVKSYDGESDLYCVELDDGTLLSCDEDDFEILHEDYLPAWSTMWQFDDSADEWWLSNDDGIREMSECGFRIFESEEFGYFFGIDGAGYNFYEFHWEPLYKARGLRWHDPAAEQQFQMKNKGYTIGKIGMRQYWMDGDRVVEEVLKSE